MATKSDLAQKLLNDLRLRKQQLAAVTAHNSDASGNLGQITEGSEKMNTLEKQIGSTIRSTYKDPSIQATTEIVSQGSGNNLRQTRDFSVALAYAFDEGGKLKSADFTSNGTLMGFLQQIDGRSMQQSLNMQSRPTNRSPTITHFDINDIATGAQKLSQILKAHSLGLKIDKGSTEIGKELWKGAMELEQSVKMLVNIQEASEKSSLKVADADDSEDDSPISTDKPKQVERPVFSFDKALKNIKGSTETGTKQRLMALTYPNEDPNVKLEKQVPITSKGTSKLSTNGNSEFQSSQHTKSTNLKHNTMKIPNVIAKLMGLEELAKEINKKIATESQTTSKQRSSAVVSTKKTNRSQVSAEVTTKYVKKAETHRIQNGVQSNKITIMKSHRPEVPKETYRVTYSYRSAANPLEPKWNEKDREAIKNHLPVSKKDIFKISELQSQITQIKHHDTSPKNRRSEIGVTRQKAQAMDDIETLQTTMEVKKRSLEAVDENQVQELKTCCTHDYETKKQATKKPLIQQKQKRESHLQQPMVPVGHGTYSKTLKPDVRSQQEANMSELEIPKGKSKLKKPQNVKTARNKLLKKTPMTQPNAVKENTAKADALKPSEALEGSDRNKVCATDTSCIDSDGQHKSLLNVEPEQNSSSTEVSELQTQACFELQVDAKLSHASATEVLDEIKPPKIGSQATKNGVMIQNVKTATKTERALNTNQPSLQKGVQRNSISEASRGHGSLSNPTQNIPENAKCTQASQQQEDAEQISTKNNTIEDESQCKEIVFVLPANDKNQDTTIASVIVDQQTVPDEIQEAKSQRATTESCNDSRNILYDLRPTQPRPTRIEKQDQLTEDEMYLKQKVMMSNVFLNTAEALFKLNIPISDLNYANDQNCQEKNSKLILDCGYEVLKRKGRNQEVCLYPCINMNTRYTKIRSLNDLVRQLHQDFETLRSYGSNGMNEYDYADYVLKMLEKDIHYSDPDLNCMWDLGWKDMTFASIEMDEAIRDTEQEVLEELLDEIAIDFMSSS